MSSLRERSFAKPVALHSRLASIRDLAVELIHECQIAKGDPQLNLEEGIDLREVLMRYEVTLIESALRLTRNHQCRAAALLGVNATTLNSKIKRYNIETRSNNIASL